MIRRFKSTSAAPGFRVPPASRLLVIVKFAYFDGHWGEENTGRCEGDFWIEAPRRRHEACKVEIGRCVRERQNGGRGSTAPYKSRFLAVEKLN